MKPGSATWWSGKIRQARRYLGATVTDAERAALADWVVPSQQGVFDRMHVADRRHGLDVVAWLRAHGESDPDVLLAGLLHDAGKGDTGFWPRVVYSLSQAYGGWIARIPLVVPGGRAALARLTVHAELSARLAEAAGCPPLTIELIRHQDDPPVTETARRFHLADEAN